MILANTRVCKTIPTLGEFCHRKLKTNQHSFHTYHLCFNMSMHFPSGGRALLTLIHCQSSYAWSRSQYFIHKRKLEEFSSFLLGIMHLAKFIIKWSSHIVHQRPATFSGTRCCSILLNPPSLQILIIFLKVFSLTKIIIIKREGFYA